MNVEITIKMNKNDNKNQTRPAHAKRHNITASPKFAFGYKDIAARL